MAGARVAGKCMVAQAIYLYKYCFCVEQYIESIDCNAPEACHGPGTPPAAVLHRGGRRAPFQPRSGDRKSVGEGTSGSVRVDLGGRRSMKHKKTNNNK